ncbi:MAG: hypothetical protein MR715_07100, partial [Subdoligranulum sp.]|nr:hypothetical protein [Subdoligranulum sp.]
PDICCLTPRSGPVSSLACGSLLDWAGSSSKSRPLTNWDAQLVIAICSYIINASASFFSKKEQKPP